MRLNTANCISAMGEAKPMGMAPVNAAGPAGCAHCRATYVLTP